MPGYLALPRAVSQEQTHMNSEQTPEKVSETIKKRKTENFI